ncbi:Druantia anti-phage system protein DruA [Candidatus Neomarinimicrobiota bacterium]
MVIAEQVVLRGRVFTVAEIYIIRDLVQKYWHEGRTKISIEICKKLEWHQPNGWLKDRACRDVLRHLDSRGIIKIPPPLHRRGNSCLRRSNFLQISPTNNTVISNVEESLNLTLVKNTPREALWNELVNNFHYLGHRVIVGKCLKFFVESDNRILAAVSLSEPAWAVKARDNILKILGFCREQVANNSRFMIMPNVRVNNLASRILALMAREGIEAWNKYYAIELKCLETFVDKSRFKGTSYKAANWIDVGITSGYRKSGSRHFNSQGKKLIFLYPIMHSDREEIRTLLCSSKNLLN